MTPRIMVLIAEGCEEIEALTPVDILRRAGLTVDMVSIQAGREVRGSHGILFLTDLLMNEVDLEAYDAVILPGGAPGYQNLKNSPRVKEIITTFNKEEKLIAAICAAPTVLAAFGVLEGRCATCYPGMEGELLGATFMEAPVVQDEHIMTSRGMGTAIDFSLAIITHFMGEQKAKQIGKSIVYL